MEKLEGNWEPKRLVIIEFESAERAKQWWAQRSIARRRRFANVRRQTNLLVIEGA